jgi:hypothetical protein
MPAKAGIQDSDYGSNMTWIPACAGMTKEKTPAATLRVSMMTRTYKTLVWKTKQGDTQ